MPHANHNPRLLLYKALGLAAAAAIAVGLQASERSDASADLYGYVLARSSESAACAFDYVDIAATGQELTLVAGHAAAAQDDGAVLLPLRRPFELYQTPHGALVVSGNGYLAAADSLSDEDGSDFSNDCSLPALADNPSPSQNRIYLYHDDLRGRRGAQLRQAHFTACPRASAAGRTEACTVVEWNGFERASPVPSTQPLRAQAVLYHDSHEIALQYASLDDSRAGQATVGLQGFDGRTAREASCNSTRHIAPRQAVCFFDPRHPAAPGVARRSTRG